jgi:hypothetical protein
MSDTEGPETDVQPFDSASNTQYRGSDKECYVQGCEGELHYKDQALVCGVCAAVTGLDRHSSGVSTDRAADSWRSFRADRPRYPGSGKVKMVGGFLEAYDWVTGSEHDGAVGDLSGTEFYR